MGAWAYYYYVKYNPDINAVLKELRNREFKAGRYNPVMPFMIFPLGSDAPSPGAQHASIEEALKASFDEGTRSILDIDHISDEPELFAASPLPQDTLVEYFDTTQPNRDTINRKMESIFENLDRGRCIYIVVYSNGKPDEILFAGYSFD